MTKEDFYKDLIEWAKSKLKEHYDSSCVDDLELKICFFSDGEPFIGRYPYLDYSSFLFETHGQINKKKVNNEKI